MFKKINNYHLYILILIVFILNTILFKSIDLTFAQFPSPPGTPGEQITNIVVNPLQEDLDLGGQSIIGDGDITADGTVCDENGCIGDNSFSGDLTVGGYKVRECNSATINSSGWYRIAVNGPMINGGNGGDRATGKFTVWDTDSSEHSAVTFYASVHFGNNPSLNLLNRSRYSGGHIDKIRLIEADTYAGAAVEIYVGSSSNLPGNTLYYCLEENFQASSWSPTDWTAGNLPSGFSATQLDLDTYDPIFAVTGNGHNNAFFVTGSGNIECTDCIDSGEIVDGAVGMSCTTSGQNGQNIPPYTIDYVYGNSCASGYIPISADCKTAYFDLRLTTSGISDGKAQCRFYNLGGSIRTIYATTRCCKLTM